MTSLETTIAMRRKEANNEDKEDGTLTRKISAGRAQSRTKSITPAFLRAHCRENDLYSTPSLNQVLYLHHKGIASIENLDAYTNLTSLWLENNLIRKIENLGHLRRLRCLFLQNNKIEIMENLEQLTNLHHLDLSHNAISSIQGLSTLVELHTLNLSYNQLCSLSAVDSLRFCSKLAVLDLGHNRIEDNEIIHVLADMNELRVLNINANPFLRNTHFYRKRLILACKSLNHLDERPVRDDDRRLAKAWKEGGAEAEAELREKLAKERNELIVQQAIKMIKARDERLARRGVAADDVAQIEALEQRGRELLGQVRQQQRVKVEAEDVLEPLASNIAFYLENNENDYGNKTSVDDEGEMSFKEENYSKEDKEESFSKEDKEENYSKEDKEESFSKEDKKENLLKQDKEDKEKNFSKEDKEDKEENLIKGDKESNELITRQNELKEKAIEEIEELEVFLRDTGAIKDQLDSDDDEC